jgi:hypothetical protein
MNNQGLFSLLKCFGTNMGDYHKLLEYIPYFENVDREFYFVRQERFCDGTWAMAAKDKEFLRIQYTFRELVEEERKREN